MPIEYSKLEGAGNEYVAIDGRNVERNWAKLATAMSTPISGVGSDGLVLVQNSDKAQVRMRVYNPDGSEAEMSGNGIRLFAKFVLDRQIVELNGDGSLVIETGGGLRTVWPTISDGKMDSARVAMGRPVFAPDRIPVKALGYPERIVDYPLEVSGRTLAITCLAIGNPHCVVFSDEPVERFPLDKIGPLVEQHPMFPHRVNVEIVNVLSRKQIQVRIFERGAGETLSSGTGSTAAMIASKLHGYVNDKVEILLPGGTLEVFWSGLGEAYLEGPANEVSAGIWPD